MDDDRVQFTPAQVRKINRERFLYRWFDRTLSLATFCVAASFVFTGNIPAASGWAVAGFYLITSAQGKRSAFRMGWHACAFVALKFRLSDVSIDEVALVLLNPPTMTQYLEQTSIDLAAAKVREDRPSD